MRPLRTRHRRNILAAAIVAVLVIPSAMALPTPGFNGAASKATLGRVFPEALQTNDYISYAEARAGLDILAEDHPDILEVIELGESYGWTNAVTGERDRSQVFLVEVTNEGSATPREAKTVILFMLSIHGNEKGGREGGLRVIEDLALGVEPAYARLLDEQLLLFLFPNPDGWTHEEVQYRGDRTRYFYETQNFVRYNGNGVDLNREAPTAGWSNEPYSALSEPESRAYLPYLKNAYPRIHYATDIHGMLNPADDATEPIACTPDTGLPWPLSRRCARSSGHFVLTMLPAGRFTAEEEARMTSLAELIKVRLNSNAHFAEWRALPSTGGYWGGEFNEWGTVYDTIGYTDSGFSSDWFAQDGGLNAPGVDFELAYNHITVDNYYPLGARLNDYHVEAVRTIVRSFMDEAAKDFDVAIDTGGRRTAYLPTSVVATNADDTRPLIGWAAENTADDAFDIIHRPFRATTADYFADLAPFVPPGHLTALEPSGFTEDRLAAFDNVVIAGSAADRVRDRPEAIAALSAYVANGGNLVLTDGALALLEPLGVAEPGTVEQRFAYAGTTDFPAADHGLLRGVRGLARMLYEPVPLGYTIRVLASPSWYVNTTKGDTALEPVGHMVRRPGEVNLGVAAIGAGRVHVIGALLPDPSEEYYHPYGLESYATTYTGNQVFRNALGWTLRGSSSGATIAATTSAAGVTDALAPLDTRAAPAVAPAESYETAPTPYPAWAVALASALVALIGRTRWRRD